MKCLGLSGNRTFKSCHAHNHSINISYLRKNKIINETIKAGKKGVKVFLKFCKSPKAMCEQIPSIFNSEQKKHTTVNKSAQFHLYPAEVLLLFWFVQRRKRKENNKTDSLTMHSVTGSDRTLISVEKSIYWTVCHLHIYKKGHKRAYTYKEKDVERKKSGTDVVHCFVYTLHQFESSMWQYCHFLSSPIVFHMTNSSP